MITTLFRRRRRDRTSKRDCFHHDHLSGESWISSELIDVGARKLFSCNECHQIWIV